MRDIFAGHLHSDFHTTIYGTNGNIPQYVNAAAKFDTGNVLKINLQ